MLVSPHSLSVPDLPFVDVTAPGFTWDDPAIAAAREECWTARTPFGVLTLRYAESAELLLDPRLHNDLRTTVVEPAGTTGSSSLDDWSNWMLWRNGEKHRRLRRLVTPQLSVSRLTEFRPLVQAAAEQQADVLAGGLAAGGGVCDFMEAFANRLPATVVHHLLGAADAGFTPAWTELMDRAFALALEPGPLPRVEEAATSLASYADTLITRHKASPSPATTGLINGLVHARQEGTLDGDELRITIEGLLTAGHDTTNLQLGHAMAAFAEYPEQWAILRDHPERVERAVDEILRYSPATPVLNWKAAAADIDHAGVHISTGTPVWIGVHAAHHDPHVFPCPGTFDITTEHQAPLLAFGGGPHYYPGAALARLELAEALTVLTARFSPPQTTGPIVWRTPIGVSGPQTLPLRFGQASAGPAPSVAGR